MENRGRGRGRGGHHGGGGDDKPRQRQNVIDLSKHVGKRIRVKFLGGREIVGVLKGYDQLLNIVMDDVKELRRDETLQPLNPESWRYIGLVVSRGPTIAVINPEDGFESIANPFHNGEE